MATTNGSLYNALTALKVQNATLGVISQNLANSESTGYKAVDAQFATILNQNYNDTSAYNVKMAGRNLVRNQGIVLASNSPLDMAIDGSGLFVVNSSVDGAGAFNYTRNGATRLKPETAFNTSGSPDKVYLTDANGYFYFGYPGADTSGATSNSPSGLTAISYNPNGIMLPRATTQATLEGTMPLSEAGATKASVSVFDTAGRQQSIGIDMTPTGSTPNVWGLSFGLDPSVGTVTSPGVQLTFDSYGKVTSPTGPVNVAVTWADGTTSNVAVDFSRLAVNGGTTEASIHTSDDDGYPGGTFKSVNIDKDGVIWANYSNNEREALATIAIAQFVEPNELNHVAGTLFSATREAGPVQIGAAGSFGSRTTLVAQALEQSNVDINTEFSNMIITQKAYTSASQLWGTVNEMIQVARDLKTV